MLNRIFIMALIIFISGCAGTKTLVGKDYSATSGDRFKIEILNTANATEAGLRVFSERLSNYESVLGMKEPEQNRTVTIEFTNYYVRHGATRAFVGVMAGSDNITTVTTVKDTLSGKIIGQVTHVTKNPTAIVGINFLLGEHADKVANFLLGK